MKAGKPARRAAHARRGGVITILASCKRLIAVLAVAVLACTGAVAGSFQFQVKDENGNITSVDVEVPSDLDDLVSSRFDEIQKALQDNNVKSDDLTKAMEKVNEVYESLLDDGTIKTDKPFTVVQDGLNAFADDLKPAIINAQSQQNVYAEAWIGNLVPGFHFGLGVNAGVSSMNVSSLKTAADTLGIGGLDDIPDKLVFPTLTADLRLGGIVFPFDVGLTVMKVNTSTIHHFDVDISPVDFDYFTLGADFRWALIRGTSLLKPRVSVGTGLYYTKGYVTVEDEMADARLNFSATTLMLSAQASAKFLFLVPFAGVRGLLAKSSVKWNVRAAWDQILPGGDEGDGENLLSQVLSWGILPENFSGGYSGFSFHPQVYAGLGLDLFVLNITVSGSYDLASQILSAAVSVRIAW